MSSKTMLSRFWAGPSILRSLFWRKAVCAVFSLSMPLAGWAQEGTASVATCEQVLTDHFRNVTAMQSVKLSGMETSTSVQTEGMPLRSKEEFDAAVAKRAMELAPQFPRCSDEQLTALARSCVEVAYGEQTRTTHSVGVRSGTRYRVVRSHVDASMLIPVSGERRSFEQPDVRAIVQGAVLAIDYMAPYRSMAPQVVQGQGQISLRANHDCRFFDAMTFYGIFERSSSLGEFLASQKRGIAWLREDSECVVLGNSGLELSFDKAHDLLIRELVQRVTLESQVTYVSTHIVNSDFRSVSGYWYPFRSTVETFEWDGATKAPRLRWGWSIVIDDCTINGGITEEDLDFVVPAPTTLIAGDENISVAVSRLPYLVEKPTLFSVLEEELNPLTQEGKAMFSTDTQMADLRSAPKPPENRVKVVGAATPSSQSLIATAQQNVAAPAPAPTASCPFRVGGALFVLSISLLAIAFALGGVLTRRRPEGQT